MKKNYKTKNSKVNLVKQIALSIFLISSTSVFGQKSPINFEPGGNGDSWTWTVFENGVNPPVEIINNPDQSGISLNFHKFLS